MEDSHVTFLGLVFLVCMAVLTWALPRKQAATPLLITICYMSLGQIFVIGGLHFHLFRILLLVGICRVFARGEIKGLQLTLADKLFAWWGVVGLFWGLAAEFSSEQFVTRSGMAYDAFGSYLLFRCWIRDLDDMVKLVRFLAWMIVPLAVSMVIEKSTHRNVFSAFGGVPAWTNEREGALRCQGAFRHPILAGTYGATLLPLFAGLYFQLGRKKTLAIVGLCSSAIVVVASRSSGPLLAMLSAFAGFYFWRIRYRMRAFRWTIVLIVAALAAVMNAPVWYLIARVSEVAGGTGWHRSYLIDQAVRHLNEWWLVGSTYTAHWAPVGQVSADGKMMDITNQYVMEGLGGGLLKLGLFLAIITVGYKTVGRLVRPASIVPRPTRIFLWCVGVCLTAHCVSFISISYFDQTVVMWYWLLAILSMLATKGAGLAPAPFSVAAMEPVSKGVRPLRPLGV